MPRNTVRFGRLFGVELRLDYSWFLVFALVTWSLASGHFPMMNPGSGRDVYWTVGLLTSVLFFASVLAHELAHGVVSRAVGVPVHDIRCHDVSNDGPDGRRYAQHEHDGRPAVVTRLMAMHERMMK
jgi:hypothetical protein